jgi:predicted phosphoribosyltransferase
MRTADDIRFRDRRDAGRRLAEHPRLAAYKGHQDVIVLALPRGGVPVAYELASALELPLEVFVVRKLGVPGREELAMGAIASGGVRVVEDEVVRELGLGEATIASVAAAERRELEERERRYGVGLLNLEGKNVLLVDDGLATGSSMRAAALALRAKDPAKVIVAVPTAPPQTCERLREIADEVVCEITPSAFWAVGAWYERFEQTTDDEVVELLRRARRERPASP